MILIVSIFPKYARGAVIFKLVYYMSIISGSIVLKIMAFDPKMMTIDPKLMTINPKMMTIYPNMMTINPKIMTMDPNMMMIDPNMMTRRNLSSKNV